jgi:outer membrane protein OmpA-like peptidoglycan-associated protein
LRRLNIIDIVGHMTTCWPDIRGFALPLLILAAGAPGLAGAQGLSDPLAALHNAEGGAIAQPRPAMPNADAPYPNLSTVPDHPPPPDAAARKALAQKLVADRANAQYETTTEPLPAPASPAPDAAAAAPPATGDDVMGAKMNATHSMPVRRPTAVADASQPATKTAPASTAPVALPAPPPVATPAAPLGTLPPMAGAPPAPPAFGGVAGTTAPTPAPVAPPPAAAPTPAPVDRAAALNAPQVQIPFAAGSDTLSGDALATLKVFAERRGAHTIRVTGFGDVDSADASAQTAGLQLALNRARAVAAYLSNVGVPPESLRVTAEAQGTGAIALLSD